MKTAKISPSIADNPAFTDALHAYESAFVRFERGPDEGPESIALEQASAAARRALITVIDTHCSVSGRPALSDIGQVADNRVYAEARRMADEALVAWIKQGEGNPALASAYQEAWLASEQAVEAVIDAHCTAKAMLVLAQSIRTALNAVAIPAEPTSEPNRSSARDNKEFRSAMEAYSVATSRFGRIEEEEGEEFNAAFYAVESAEVALYEAADALASLAPAADPVEFNVDAFLMETLEEMDFDAVLMEHITAAVHLDADKPATLAAEKAAPRAALLAHFHTSGDAVNATVRTFGAKAFLAGLKAAA
jgi:hypothetical protein